MEELMKQKLEERLARLREEVAKSDEQIAKIAQDHQIEVAKRNMLQGAIYEVTGLLNPDPGAEL